MKKIINKITKFFYLKYLRDNNLDERHNIFNLEREQGVFYLDVEDIFEQIVIVDGVITLYVGGNIQFHCGYITEKFRNNSFHRIKGIKVLNSSLRPTIINLN